MGKGHPAASMAWEVREPRSRCVSGGSRKPSPPPGTDLLSRPARAGLRGEAGPPRKDRASWEAGSPWKPGQQLNVTRGTGGLPVGRAPKARRPPALGTQERHIPRQKGSVPCC